MHDKIISKKMNLSIKAIAIMLMLIHHLYAFPNRIIDQTYISVWQLNNIAIEYYLALFSKICVSIFLFLSGYGMYITYFNKKPTIYSIIKRIKSFYFKYWFIFVIFIIIGIAIGKINTNYKEIVLNFFGFSSSLNGEWWFIKVYIILIAIYPLINKFIKAKSILIILSSLMLYLFSLILTKISVLSNYLVISSIALVFSQQIYFIMGALVAKDSIFDKSKLFLNKKKLDNKIIYILILFISVFMYYYLYNNKIMSYFIYIIVMPIFVLSLVNLIKENKLLNFIGMNSTNIWLIHSFLCYYYFQNIIFYPKFSIFIFVWLLMLSLIISIGLEYLYCKLKSIYNLNKNNFFNADIYLYD